MPMRQALLLLPFYRCYSGGTEGSSHLPKILRLKTLAKVVPSLNVWRQSLSSKPTVLWNLDPRARSWM